MHRLPLYAYAPEKNGAAGKNISISIFGRII